MKVQKILGLVCFLVLASPILAGAEIYKWKDKNGVTRYSDTPPSSKVKVDTLKGKSVSKPAEVKEMPQGANETAAQQKRPSLEFKDPPVDTERQAAKIRARNAEIEKKNNLINEKEAKANKESCAAAKSNYAAYKQGGRLYKTDENGGREYYGEAELNAQQAKEEAKIRKYCK